MEQTYFRRGFGLKGRIEGALTADYHSHVVDRIRQQGYVLAVGDLTFKLAGEFGFCYGVDRAVEYAYETRTKFPDKRIFLVGEIIHNPHVNLKLRARGFERQGVGRERLDQRRRQRSRPQLFPVHADQHHPPRGREGLARAAEHVEVERK